MDKNKTMRAFDVGENEDEAHFPMKKISGVDYIIISKKNFKVFETDKTYVLEYLEEQL